ncbi:MAG: hypothetical protein ACFCUJ_03870 [Thiotrichales bacterium]
MRGMVPPDPQTKVSDFRFAVVYVPKRNRKRFSANCVELFDSSEAARAAATPDNFRYPARVLGPSKSSEGQFLYYLIEWL